VCVRAARCRAPPRWPTCTLHQTGVAQAPRVLVEVEGSRHRRRGGVLDKLGRLDVREALNGQPCASVVGPAVSLRNGKQARAARGRFPHLTEVDGLVLVGQGRELGKHRALWVQRFEPSGRLGVGSHARAAGLWGVRTAPGVAGNGSMTLHGQPAGWPARRRGRGWPTPSYVLPPSRWRRRGCALDRVGSATVAGGGLRNPADRLASKAMSHVCLPACPQLLLGRRRRLQATVHLPAASAPKCCLSGCRV